MKIADIDRRSDTFRDIVDAAVKGTEVAFAKKGLPLPEFLDDIILSVMLDAVEEIIIRVNEVESRESV